MLAHIDRLHIVPNAPVMQAEFALLCPSSKGPIACTCRMMLSRCQSLCKQITSHPVSQKQCCTL